MGWSEKVASWILTKTTKPYLVLLLLLWLLWLTKKSSKSSCCWLRLGLCEKTAGLLGRLGTEERSNCSLRLLLCLGPLWLTEEGVCLGLLSRSTCGLRCSKKSCSRWLRGIRCAKKASLAC